MSKDKHVSQQKNVTKGNKRNIENQQPSMMIWVASLAAIISVALSFITIEPTIAIRYMILSIFCIGFVVYFFTIKKYSIPSGYPLLIKLIFISSLLYFLWSAVGLNQSINCASGLYELLRQLLNAVILFLFIEIFRREAGSIITVCKVILIVSMVHSFIGILQFYGLGFLNIPGANAQPYGLMANRNLYGSAQALVIPFVFFVWFSGSATWKKTSLFALALLSISILLSQTRSAWIATVVIFAATLVLLIIFYKEKRKQVLKWGGVLSIAILALITLILFINKSIGVDNTISERALSFTGNATAASQTVENVNARLLIWKKTAELIKDKPVFGVGLNNWKIAIASYGAEKMPWSDGNFVPDRPHNVYLQIMAESGIPGFVFYLGTWLLVVITGFVALKNKNLPVEERLLILLMLAGLAGFASDSMFSFPAERIEHSFYLLLMCGVVAGIYLKNLPVESFKLKTPSKPLLWLMIIIGLANMLMAYKKYSFEAAMNRAQALENEGRFAEEIDVANAGKSAWVTMDPEGHTMEMRTGLAYKALHNTDMALKEMEQAKIYNPYSPLILSNIGAVYIDKKDYQKATTYYKQALKYAPDFSIVKINLAAAYYDMGLYAACLKSLETVDLTANPKVRDLQNLAKAKLVK